MIPPKREMIACILSEAHDRDISFFAGFGTSFLWCGSLAHAPVQEAHPIKRSFDTHCLCESYSHLDDKKQQAIFRLIGYPAAGILPITRIGSTVWSTVDKIINSPSLLDIARRAYHGDRACPTSDHPRPSALIDSAYISFGRRTRNSVCRIISTRNTSHHCRHHRQITASSFTSGRTPPRNHRCHCSLRASVTVPRRARRPRHPLRLCARMQALAEHCEDWDMARRTAEWREEEHGIYPVITGICARVG